MNQKILVIEDDQDIASLVKMHLQDTGYDVQWIQDGPAGLQEALSRSYDLIILDLKLPGLNGLDICQNLRSKPKYTPILMLTARSSELDRVLGLEIGADDYLTKPFSIRELLARVNALFRRIDALGSPSSQENQKQIQIGNLWIETLKRKVSLGGKPVNLTAREFDLLKQFAQHPGMVYTRSQLLDLVWGYGHDGYEHTVNSHINRLRAKIEKDPTKPHFILTVWGIGYKFFEPEYPQKT